MNGTIGIGFDLDSPISFARDYSGYGRYLRNNYFRSHVVTLAPGEARTFTFDLKSFQRYCQFTFQMSVATPNGPVTEIISNHGKPFGITGTAVCPHNYSSYSALYVGGIMATLLHLNKTGGWVPENPANFKSG